MGTVDAIPADEFEGRILDIEGGKFSALLVSPEGTEFVADFDVACLPSDEVLRVGDVFAAPSMRLLRLGSWTEAELAEIRSRAHVWLLAFRHLID